MDLRTIYNSETRAADLALMGPQLDIDDGLETAIVISLFTDRRAESAAETPDTSGQLRGWFGDGFADIDGDRIGSHLWLLQREKQTPEVLQRARDYARDALQWLVKDGIARSVDVQASWVDKNTLAMDVQITRSNAASARFQFNTFWGGLNGV